MPKKTTSKKNKRRSLMSLPFSTSTRQPPSSPTVSLAELRASLSNTSHAIVCLAKAKELAVPGADIATICSTVDAMIEEEVKKTFASKKSKNLERGIAFPTCISVNHIMGHYSPLVDESTQL